MPAYLIANVDVTDSEGYEEYARRVPETIHAYGGSYLVRGGTPESLEGSTSERVVILEFETREALLSWYHSPEYSAIKGIRLANSQATVTVVDGV